jgi:hypothetical protein
MTDELKKTGAVKFSPELEAEIASLMDIHSEGLDEDDPPPTRVDVIKELMQDSEDREHSASDFKNELRDFGIAIGVYKPYTKEQLENVYVNRGKKYDFRRGGKFYSWESWKPLEESHG